MTLGQDEAALAAAKTQLSDLQTKETADIAAVNQDDTDIANTQQTIADLEAKIAGEILGLGPWLGSWCHGRDETAFEVVRGFAPHVTAFRWRGDDKARFDFAFDSTAAFLLDLAHQGLRVSGNFNLRLGKSPQKTAVKLLDVAGGKYDSDIIGAAKILAPFADGDCEIMSEINVQHGATASQPSFADWSLPNAEAAFLHVAALFRSNGVKVKLGTSIAGPHEMANHKAWITPAMAKASDFVGFDFYKRKAGAVNMPSVAIPIALKAAGEMGLPLIVCETGVDKTLGISGPFFVELLAQVKRAPSGSILGVVCTNGDAADGPYVYDVGSPNHVPFVAMAADPFWRA